MSFVELLKAELNPIGIHPNYLPATYRAYGDIAVIKLKENAFTYKEKIGNAIIKVIPTIKTVCLLKSIDGIKRIPNIEIIAGENKTKSSLRENGIVYKIDLSKAMFSQGNKFEKERVISLASSDETVVDMFAGIGYWALPLAKKVKRVLAIDINPQSIESLEENVLSNRITNIQSFIGDCRDFSAQFQSKADRVLVGYFNFGLSSMLKFLPTALKMCKINGTVHFHSIIEEDDLDTAKKSIESTAFDAGFNIQTGLARKVKSYAPRIWHIVWDLKRV